jgi:hypothetical protein
VLGLDAEESNTSHEISQSNNKNWKLRGVQWRVDLDVLPRKPAPVDELRRAAADGRRRSQKQKRSPSFCLNFCLSLGVLFSRALAFAGE